jgi:hypothetical protein
VPNKLIGNPSIHMAKVMAAEKAATDNLHEVFGLTKEEFERRMNAPYKWPHYSDGTPVPQGSCSACRKIDARHPNGTACDYSCVGI